MRWKAVRGFEGYYEVSDHGDVRSVDRKVCDTKGVIRHLSGRMMKSCRAKGRNNDGYYVVNLRKGGAAHVIPIHILVATAFLPNPDDLPTVNHKDGNKTNNDVQNLEWATYRENNMHALRFGLRRPRGSSVVQINDSGRVVARFRSVCEASRSTGIGRSSISHCVNGRVSSAGGFAWQKLSEGVTTIS